MDKDIKIKKFLLNEKVQKIIKSDDTALPNTPGGDQKNNGSDEYNTICRAFGRVLKAYIEESSAKKRMYIEFLQNASIRDERRDCLKDLIENNTLLKMGAVKTEVLVTGDKKYTRYIREHELVDAGAVAVICDLTGEKPDLIFTVNGFLKQPARGQCQTLQNHALKRSENPVPYYKAKFQAAEVMLYNVPYHNPDVDFVALQNIIERFLKKIPIKITYAKKHIDSESRELNKNRFTINGETCNINWSTIVGRALLEGRAEKNHFHLAAVILSWVTYRTYNKKEKDKVDANDLLNDLLTSFEFESDEAKLQEIISRLSRGMVEEEQDKELISLIADDFKNIEARKSEVETKIKKRDGHITAQDLLLNDDRGAAQPKRYFNNRICHIQDIFSYDDIKNDINDIDPIASVSNILDDFSERIVQAVNKQPLMRFLSIQGGNYIHEYRFLANTICRYNKTEKKFFVKPVVSTLLHRIKNELIEYCMSKEYTHNEMIRIISYYAEQASHAEDYSFTLQINDLRNDEKNIQSQIIKDILDLKICDKKLIIKGENGKCKFSLKQYRLVFRALYYAYDQKYIIKVNAEDELKQEIETTIENVKFGDYEAAITRLESIVGSSIGNLNTKIKSSLVKEITNLLLDDSNFKQVDENADEDNYYPAHAKLKFDSLIIFSFVFLSEIDNYLFYPVIDKLCEVINDFSPSNRKRQEAAISILAYLLCEDKWIDSDYRKKMFFFAYGQSIYRNAADLWELIPEKSIVNMKKINSVIWEGGFAKSQPFYIYFWNYAQPQSITGNVDIHNSSQFLSVSCALQYHTWFGMNNYEDTYSTLTGNIKKCLHYATNFLQANNFLSPIYSTRSMKFHESFPKLTNQFHESTFHEKTSNLLEYIYGLNMLLAALANITRAQGRMPDSGLFLPESFWEVVILTDYLTRRVNREYNESFDGDVTAQKNQMMLLCGATRVLAVKSLREKIGNQTVDLNSEMQKNYNKWLSNESGRYKILLLRLLSFTNFVPKQSDSDLIAEIKTVMEEESTNKNSVFMEYDNINASEILKHIGNNKSWKDCLSATEQ